jgi:glycosyltransferase involved in cell wall biosynthesis
MKLFGIMLVKNEADVIRYTLGAAEASFDRIYVLDNGSTDETWEIVKELASAVIVPWARDSRPYHNGLRADVFNAFRDVASVGDWWCYKMDADEIYVDDPKSFLSAVPPYHHVVFKRSIDYVLTRQDVKRIKFTGHAESDLPHVRHFLSTAYSEPRFFRHRDGLRWPSGTKSPRRMGIPHSEPITLRHYQWRSPQQIQSRLDLRNSIPKDKRGKPFRHISARNWREVLGSDESLLCDDGSVDVRTIPLRSRTGLSPIRYAFRRIWYGIGGLI